jgi:hypothetical protein
MSRLMSVAFTEAQVRDRTKTVTRRKGWTFLKPGDHLTLCRKVMGRKKGEPLERIVNVEVIDVRREPLGNVLQGHATHNLYGQAEMEREGFPGLDPALFIARYFAPQGLDRNSLVTRIQWRYLDEEVTR